jgi:hypothetical protein
MMSFDRVMKSLGRRPETMDSFVIASLKYCSGIFVVPARNPQGFRHDLDWRKKQPGLRIHLMFQSTYAERTHLGVWHQFACL